MAEYIRGEKLIDKASRMCIECEENNSERCNECLAACVLDEERVADVAPVRHGKWISVNMAYGEYKCSVCDGMDSDCSDYYGSHGVLDQEYCPWCGAKMDGAE